MTITAGPNNVLEAIKLTVSALSGEERRELIHDVSFDVRAKEVLIVLGESGSGKTILSRALTRLFPLTSGVRLSGSVSLEGQQLLDLGERELTRIRRHRIRYVFQEPMQSLNPLARIGTQMRLALASPSHNHAVLKDTLRLVGLDNSEEVLGLYPHELSIGMAQRVCIAMAVLPSPALLIADEPTSGVDASLKRRILDLLISLQRNGTLSLILITHDLNVARCYGDRIIVMYGGRIIESASSTAFFEHPLHPYSRQLVDSQPLTRTHTTPAVPTASAIATEIPKQGCSFQPRCPIAQAKCKESEPKLEQVPGEREVRCLYWQ